MDLFPGYSEFSFSHRRAASPTSSHITSCPGFGEESPSTPCRAQLAPLSHPAQGQKGMQKMQQFPRKAPGALQEWEHRALTKSTGHISHRQAQAADLTLKLLDAALHELFVGLQNAKETFRAPLETPPSQRNCSFLQEEQQSIPLCPAQHQHGPGTTNPTHLCHPGQGANPQPSPKTRTKIKAGKQ